MHVSHRSCSKTSIAQGEIAGSRNVEGGYAPYRAALAAAGPVAVDARRLKCPGRIVEVADVHAELPAGQLSAVYPYNGIWKMSQMQQWYLVPLSEMNHWGDSPMIHFTGYASKLR